MPYVHRQQTLLELARKLVFLIKNNPLGLDPTCYSILKKKKLRTTPTKLLFKLLNLKFKDQTKKTIENIGPGSLLEIRGQNLKPSISSTCLNYDLESPT